MESRNICKLSKSLKILPYQNYFKLLIRKKWKTMAKIKAVVCTEQFQGRKHPKDYTKQQSLFVIVLCKNLIDDAAVFLNIQFREI